MFSTSCDFAVGLVHPFLKEARNKNRLKFRESLALGYLSAALKARDIPYHAINAELQFLDSQVVARRLIERADIKLVGLSCKSQRTYRAGREIAQIVKRERPDIHITMGGVLATAADKQVLQDCEMLDSVVRGEGEEAIVELAERVRNGLDLSDMAGLTWRSGSEIVRNKGRRRVAELDDLPFPLRDDLKFVRSSKGAAEASAYIVASRGCYAACTFCSIHQIYGNRLVVRRSPRNVVQEIEQIIEDHDVRRFSFVDDIFLVPSRQGERWVEEFCDLIYESKLDINFYAELRADTLNQPLLRKLMRAGMHRIFIGFEAGADSVLKRWDKGTTVVDNDKAILELKKSNIKSFQINLGYIMFDPEMTYSELKQQYFWVKNTGYAKVQHLQNKMNIYWGTPHYDRMVAQGRVANAPFGDRWDYEFDHPQVEFVEKCLRNFHSRFEDESVELLTAKEEFRSHLKAHEDLTAATATRWLVELLTHAHRRIEKLERGLYFLLFESAFEELDRGGETNAFAREAFMMAFWGSLTPVFAQLHQEARYLSALIAAAPKLMITGDADWRSRKAGTAGYDDRGQIAWARIREQEGIEVVFVVRLGPDGEDRYDHRCEIRVLRDGDFQKLEEIKVPTPQISYVLPPNAKTMGLAQ